jgi:hypothetical protein
MSRVPEVPPAAVQQVSLAAVQQVSLAAVQQRERDTMHPHFITAMLLMTSMLLMTAMLLMRAMLLRVDAIPIHPARKYAPG